VSVFSQPILIAIVNISVALVNRDPSRTANRKLASEMFSSQVPHRMLLIAYLAGQGHDSGSSPVSQ